jgi:hypothetical protein
MAWHHTKPFGDSRRKSTHIISGRPNRNLNPTDCHCLHHLNIAASPNRRLPFAHGLHRVLSPMILFACAFFAMPILLSPLVYAVSAKIIRTLTRRGSIPLRKVPS